MPDSNDIPARRGRLLDVTQAAAEVSRLTREACDLSLPVEPGVRDGRDALGRWAVLLEAVIPSASQRPPSMPGAVVLSGSGLQPHLLSGMDQAGRDASLPACCWRPWEAARRS
jgi:hypothetical protein